MESIYALSDIVIGIFSIPGLNLYWGNFIVGLFLAGGVYYYLSYTQTFPSNKSLLSYIFPRKVLFHRSSITDYGFLVPIKLFMVFCYPTLMEPLLNIAYWLGELIAGFERSLVFIQLRGLIGTTEINESIGWSIGFSIYMMVIVDFALFFAHYLMHKSKFLWEFHKVHHSAQVLNPITVARMHPVDYLVNGTIILACSTVGVGLWLLFIPFTFEELTILGSSMFIFLFYLLGGILRHSHVWLSYGKKIEHFLISPAQHQVHHSAMPKHYNKNMGMKLAIWDHLFGTLYTTTSRPEVFRMGLYAKEDREYNSILKCLYLPLLKLIRKK
ncbi:sterol desaturase family protein [Neptuniibacter sp. QD37_11]|uniref:sterol desaturase family protein n=1 Tax=Neptuniibacter sp. QD37_11 TaxID=3398209 RepID=UPI0039F5F906